MPSVKIGISKASGNKNYELYEQWLKAADPSVECIDLSLLPAEDAVQALGACAGLVLSGGPDVDPELYEKPEERARCTDLDRGRDKVELALIQRSRLINLPVMAISRGMQLFNVFLGGTLTVDLAIDKPSNIAHGWEDDQAEHALSVIPQSLLHHMTGIDESRVISTHRQGIEKLSWYLKASATAPDGLVEAYEWSDPVEKGFLLGVQWHAERLPFEHPLSGPIAKAFLDAAKAYVPHHRID
jgi:putative glutamine amidotransferase